MRVLGEGPPTILLATDPPNVLEHYDDLARRLAADARVVVFEPPGFGFSTAKRGYAHTLAHLEEAVRGLLLDLGEGPFVLAFPCLAGYAALNVAAARPDLVESVVVMQTPSYDEEARWASRIDRRGLLRRPVLGQALMSLAKRPVARSWYRAAVPEHRREPFERTALAALRKGARFPLADAMQGAFASRPEVRPTIRPVLAVWGAKDRSHAKTDAQSILRHAPQARVEIFEEAGHFPELEEPERFRRLLLEFLD